MRLRAAAARELKAVIIPRYTIVGLAAAVAACLAAGCTGQPASRAPPSRAKLMCPYAPWYEHAYRHGAVPTRETQQRMRGWYASHAAAAVSNVLSFGGGIDGIGVTSGTPRVYLVFYGSQWGSGGDPQAAAAYLQSLFTGLGTGGELWSGTMTQYCDGTRVAKGATSCPAGASHVGYPGSGALAGVWFDTAVPSPGHATPAQLAAEAVSAARHFGNSTPAGNRYAQYLIVSPAGTHPDGFNTPGSNFCGWHDYTASAFGDIAYANLPYVSDGGASCGENFVNEGATGVLDGFSIVGGHEYAEVLTDQNPAGGWTNAQTGGEDGDECAWIATGQGASANVSTGNGAYAMQSIWSNDTNQCEIAHPIE
jgi:serine protease